MPRVDLKSLPPAEAVKFFRDKGFRIGFDWRDVWQAEHGKAFTVAKAMSVDILQDIRAAVDGAIANGTTFADFQRQLTPTLQAKGWWGKRPLRDPRTGETKTVQLGSPRRLRTIFDVNLRTSYAVGKYERSQRVKARRPYGRYVSVRDEQTRPKHLAWHGTVLPVDDPWWEKHFPPNGFGCRCIFQQLSQRDLDRMGITVSDPPPVKTRRVIDKRTGRAHDVPEGIDFGWDYHVGRAGAANARDVLIGKLEAVNPALARAGIGSVVRSSNFADFLTGTAPGDYPVGLLPRELGQVIGADAAVVRLSRATADKQRTKRQELGAPAYGRIQRMLDEGDVIADKDQHLVFMLEDQDWYLAVVKATKDGRELFLQSYRRTTAEQRQRDLKRGKIIRGGE